MKVNIGPYKKWYGPYQIAEKLLWWHDPDSETVWHLGRRLDKTWLHDFCNRFKRERKVKVHVDDYDVWNMDDTLSKIIYPLLVRLSGSKQGVPIVDLEDVPEHLRGTEHDQHSNQQTFEWYASTGDLAAEQARWDWVLYELLWTFEQLNKDWESQYFDHSMVDESRGIQEQVAAIKCDWDGLYQHEERIKRGLYLFGKYYRSLWT